MFSSVTASVSIDGTLSLMPLATSSDSKRTIAKPVLSFRVQYPATNPGACDTPGTTCSRKWLVAASRSLTVTVVTTACMGASFVAGWHGDSIPAEQPAARTGQSPRRRLPELAAGGQSDP